MSGQYKKIHWTEHSKLKMRQYGISKTKVLHLLFKPDRKEKGIAEGTMAVMKTNKLYGNTSKAQIASRVKKVPGEIWLMYTDSKEFRKIISAWRYPGISKPGESIPVPQDILDHLTNGNS